MYSSLYLPILILPFLFEFLEPGLREVDYVRDVFWELTTTLPIKSLALGDIKELCCGPLSLSCYELKLTIVRFSLSPLLPPIA